LLDVLGAPTEHPLMGRSLWPLMRGEATAARPVLMECERFGARKRGYLRWPFKLIVDGATHTSQLFALTDDPREQRNLAILEPLLLRAMQTELYQVERWLSGSAVAPGAH
jgi:hypothetical protein